MQKRIPSDPSGFSSGKDANKGLSFVSLTESMSMSSEEMAETVTKTFSLFSRPSEDSSNDSDTLVYEDDGASETIEVELESKASTISSTVTTTMMSPSERAERLLDRLMTTIEESPNIKDESNAESPLRSLTSGSEVTSDEEGEEEGSRVVSLLDTVNSLYDDDSDDSDGTDSTGTDGGTPTSLGTTTLFEDFPEDVEDALAAIGGAVYRLGSCDFQNMNAHIVDDEIRGRVVGSIQKPSISISTKGLAKMVPPDAREKGKNFFQEMFRCGGV